MTADLNQTTKTRETTLCERCRYHEIGGKSRLLVAVKLNLLKKKTPKKTKNKTKKQYNNINNAKPTGNKPSIKTNSIMFKCIKYIQYSISA